MCVFFPTLPFFFMCILFSIPFPSPHTFSSVCILFMCVFSFRHTQWRYAVCILWMYVYTYCVQCTYICIVTVVLSYLFFTVIHLLLQLFLKNFFLEILKEKKNIWTNFIREVSIGNSDINIILAQGLSIIAKTRPVSLFWNLQKKMIIGTWLTGQDILGKHMNPTMFLSNSINLTGWNSAFFTEYRIWSH